jgi:hypothetical protein
MSLGDLIKTLEAEDPALLLPVGFVNPHSYRGDYMDLAFEPAANIPVGDCLASARSALGTTYEGWKGGQFTMNEHSWCWLSEEGTASCESLGPTLLRLMIAHGKAARFVAARAEFVTAIDNCRPDNYADYHRWQGHAESRRVLAKELGLPVAWPIGHKGAEAGGDR